MRRGTILLVEDNPDDVTLTRRAFEKNNLSNDIEVAFDGVEALARLSDPERDVPSLILLDLNLPKIDGLEVLRRIRADGRTRIVPVVILTSSREEQDLIRGYLGGANSYIRKPVDFAQFIEAVRQLGLYWLMINEAPPSIREEL